MVREHTWHSTRSPSSLAIRTESTSSEEVQHKASTFEIASAACEANGIQQDARRHYTANSYNSEARGADLLLTR